MSPVQRCRDLQLHILHWTVVMAICFNQLVSHCAVIRRIIPNSGRRNSKMVFKENTRSTKRLLFSHDTLHDR